MFKITYALGVSLAIALIIFTSGTRAQEVAPTILPLGTPVVVDFTQLANYEKLHPLKKRKRYIEQGEDREKNGNFIPQPVPPNSPRFQITPSQGLSRLLTVSPAPANSFNGTLDNGTLIPPDVRGTAGLNHVMETNNQEFKIFTKAGALVSTLSITTFFSASSGANYFDPHILYDANNSRYVICIAGDLSTGHSGGFLAISQTNNPTGLWFVYSFDGTGNTSDFLDYPLLGINSNWVVITGRDFLSTGPVHPRIFVFNRATVYGGSAGTVSVFTDPTNSLTIAPAHTYDVAQNTEYLVCNLNGNSGGNGFVRLSTITGTASTPAYTVGSSIGVASPWNDNGNITVGASQSGTTTKIESGDSRIGNAIFINGSLWFCHTAYLPAASPTHSAADWWQVNPVTPSVTQFGRIEDATTFNFYTSINVNANNDVLVGFCTSSSSSFASSAYAFHAGTDPANSMQTPFIYKTGLASYNKTFGSGRNRYGDYTGMSMDPVDNSFWNFSEWAMTGNNWGTVIANIAASGPVVLSTINTSGILPTSFCAGASLNVSYTINASANAGNIFTAQLSNSAGSFASPTAIGTLSSTTAGTIAAIIPAGTASGTGYRIRVVSSAPVVTGGDNGSNLTISAQVAAAGGISGISGFCAWLPITFSVGAIANATTYIWSAPAGATITNGQGSAQVTVVFPNTITSGNMTVFGSNANCTGASSTFPISILSTPGIPTTSNATGCSGIPITLTGSPVGGTWSVANPYTGPSTTFYYTVVNATTGCSASSTLAAPLATITVSASPIPSITGNISFCAGSSTVLNGGSGFSSYSWSTGATTQSVTVNTGGTFTVTVTNANGCSGSASAGTTVNSNPAPSVTGIKSFCGGSSTILNAGSGFTSYNWSTGATTQSVSISTGATFTVTVTNASGCTGSASATTIVNSNPVPSVTGTTAFCAGSSTVLNSGAGFSSYNWSTGATTQSVSVNAAGTFTVTVTNANGCTGSASAVTTVNSNPNPSISGSTSFCTGGSTVLISDPGFISYNWSTGATTQSVSVITAGTFTVTVTNTSGCSASASVVTTINSNLNPSISGSTAFCAGSSTALSADAGFTGYLWSTGESTQTIAVATAGTFTVTVTNAGGCSGSASVITTVNSNPVPSISGITSFCAGSSTVLSADFGFTGYNWSTGASAQSITVSTQGTFTVTVTNSYGCSGSISVVTTINANPTPSIGGNTSFCAGSSTILSASTGFTVYNWSTGASSQSIAVSSAGTFTVTVTNADGCTGSIPVITTVNPLPAVSFSGLASTYFSTDAAAALTGSPSGGSFSGPGISGTSFDPSLAGVGGPYDITYSYTDGNGCSSSSTLQTTVIICTLPAQPGTISEVGGTTKVCPGDTRTYKINAVAGALSYTWTPPAGSAIATGQGTKTVTINYLAGFTSSGTLKVVAVNSCGSSTPRSKTISLNPPVKPGVISGQVAGVCNQTGLPYSVTVVSGITYNWTYTTFGATVVTGQGSNAITADYSGFTSGNLSITAGNGCGVSASRTLAVKSIAATPGTISGATGVCINQHGVPYSIIPVFGATTYTWVGPNGSRFSDGVTTSTTATFTTASASVTANFATTAGQIKVRTNNACGSSIYKTLSVSFVCREGVSFMNHEMDLSVFPNPASTDITVQFISRSQNKYLIRLTDLIGKTVLVKSGNANDGQNLLSLDLSGLVKGIYTMEVSDGINTNYKKVIVE